VAALAVDREDIQLQADVGRLDPDHLGPAGAGVEQQHEQGGVASALEGTAGAGGEEPLEGLLGDDRDRLLGNDGLFDLGHRVGRDLLFLGQPAIQDLEDLVVGGGGAGLPAGEQVAQERLEIGPGGGLQAGAAASEEGVGLATAMR
jgi:hypothetical protein